MMNTRTRLTVGTAATAVVAALALSPAAQALRPAATVDAAATTLSTNQLVAMYEEERVSGDVYDAFAEKYDARIFTMIGNAEERHQAAVATLLEARGYDVGSLPSTAGDYRTDGYDEWYTELVADGSGSLDDAYEVGVTIEKADIADLDELLADTTDDAEVRVLTALENGSEHHLAAFSGDADGLMAGPGYGQENGRGMGMGMGRMGGAGGYGDGTCDGAADRDGVGNQYGLQYGNQHGRGWGQPG